MHQRPLGTSGLSVGAIAFGCWRFAGVDTSIAARRISTALDCGMTLVDTADVYGLDNDCEWGDAESLLGDVFAASPGLRDQIVLATKGGIQLERGVGLGVPYDASGEHIRNACDASLRRLRTDRIDLYQIHRPDLLAHPAETAGALDALIAAGKVRFVGVSNYAASQTAALQSHLQANIVSVQPEFSIACLTPIDDGVLDQAMQLGCTPLAWSPLAGGRLVVDDAPDERFRALGAVLDELAGAYNSTRTGIALAFLLGHPAGVIPIVGTGRPERIVEAAAAADVVLAKDDCYRLVAAAGRSLP